MARHWKLEYAADLVAKWEGLITTAYLDTLASPPVLTLGYGHTKYAGSPIPYVGERITEEEAKKVLAHDLRATARAVSEKITWPLTFRQRMALISAAFNLGPGILDDLAPLVNHGHIKAAARKLEGYDHDGHGVVIEGLKRRRKNEAWLLRHDHLPSPHRPTPTHPKRPAKHRRGARHLPGTHR